MKLSPRVAGMARDTRQKRGSPPIAAMSLKLRARAFVADDRWGLVRQEVNSFDGLIGG